MGSTLRRVPIASIINRKTISFSLILYLILFQQCLIHHYFRRKLFSLCSFNNENFEDTIEQLDHEDLDEIRRLPSCEKYLNSGASKDCVIGFFFDNYLKLKMIEFYDSIRIYWQQFFCGLRILNLLQENLPDNLFGRNVCTYFKYFNFVFLKVITLYNFNVSD